MQKLFNWLITKKGKKPNVEIKDIEDAKKIVAPINTDDKKMSIFFNGDVQNVYVIDKIYAETIKRNANDELLTFSKPEEVKEDQTNAKNVLLKFNQIEGAEKNNKKTKGIISEISNKSYPVMFAEGLKHSIVHGSENPHNKNYLVNAKILFWMSLTHLMMKMRSQKPTFFIKLHFRQPSILCQFIPKKVI
jgi:hypothetical protein